MAHKDPVVPENNDSAGKSSQNDPFNVGEALLERAKKVARDIDEKVRKLTEKDNPITDDTKTNTPIDGTPQDPTDEAPPVA